MKPSSAKAKAKSIELKVGTAKEQFKFVYKRGRNVITVATDVSIHCLKLADDQALFKSSDDPLLLVREAIPGQLTAQHLQQQKPVKQTTVVQVENTPRPAAYKHLYT